MAGIERQITTHRINEKSDSYKEEIERAKTRKPYVLGQHGLYRYDRYPEERAREDLFQEEKDRIQEGLQQYGAFGYWQQLGTFVEEGMSVDPRMAELLQPYIDRYAEDNLENRKYARAFRDALTESAVSNDAMAALVTRHKASYESLAQDITQEVEGYKKEFLERVQLSIQSGYLVGIPSFADIERRVRDVPVQVYDPMVGNDIYIPEGLKLGTFNNFSLGINPTQSQPDRRRTVFHELVHAALAGKTITLDETKLNEVTIAENVYTKKNGLRHRFQRQNNFTKNWLEWLDEAVTETLALHLLGEKSSESYREEREQLQHLLDSGVSWQIILQAYQENYQPNLAGEKRLPKLDALLQELRAHMGNEWLRTQGPQ